MIFDKNILINETLDNYFETWSHCVDTGDFVQEKFLDKIDKYIYKNLVKSFKQIEIYSLLQLKDMGVKLGLFDKLKIWFSGIEPIYNAEKKQKLKLEKMKAKKARSKSKRKPTT